MWIGVTISEIDDGNVSAPSDERLIKDALKHRFELATLSAGETYIKHKARNEHQSPSKF